MDMTKTGIAAIERAAAHENCACVPEGWKLVPVEPTVAQLYELMSDGEKDAAIGMTPMHAALLIERAGISYRYAAMLAATPAAPTATIKDSLKVAAPTEGARDASAQQDEREPTGWAEADAIIGRLMSDDPDFDDCQDAATFIRRMYDEHMRGPDGYATWKEAAIAERVMRVKNICLHGIHMDNACGACIPPRGTTVREKSKRAAQQVQADAAVPTISELTALLPGPYYMDPPDGGSVTLLEQLQRMSQDAARWRNQVQANAGTAAAVTAPTLHRSEGVRAIWLRKVEPETYLYAHPDPLLAECIEALREIVEAEAHYIMDSKRLALNLKARTILAKVQAAKEGKS